MLCNGGPPNLLNKLVTEFMMILESVSLILMFGDNNQMDDWTGLDKIK